MNDAPVSPGVKSLPKRIVVIPTMGLVAMVSLMVAYRSGAVVSRWTNPADLTDLVKAVGSQRTIEPRLAGGFAYGDLAQASTSRSGKGVETTTSPDIRIAAARLEKLAHDNHRPQVLGAFGVALLVVGQSNGAIDSLEEASQQSPHDSLLLTNLAAAYLVRAKDGARLDDVARAVSAAQRATGGSPTLAEARFNLALAIEALSLREESRKAWHEYLKVDSASAWAAEARRHLDQLSTDRWSRRWDDEKRQIVDAVASTNSAGLQPLVDRFPDTAYEYAEDELLPAWASACVEGHADAANEAFRRGRAIGDALAAGTGDRMIADAFAAIERQSNMTRRLDLARAHRTFSAARELYRQDKFQHSVDPFSDAGAIFDRTGSAFAEWTTYYLATAAYYRGSLADAISPLDSLIAIADRGRHLSVLGRALRLRGLINSLRGNVVRSLDDYERALSAFDRAHATEELASIHSVIAQRLEAVGDARSAWGHRQESLARLASVRRDPYTLLLSTGSLAKRQGFLHAALAFQTEALAAATTLERAIDVVQARLDRSDVHHLLGYDELANADVDEAARWAGRIPDAGAARRAAAEAELAKGELTDVAAPARALDSLSRSLEYFRASGMDQRLARVYRAIGRAQVSAGHPEQAEESYLKGIDILERQRALLPSGGLRLGYFDMPWNLFDDVIGLLSDQESGSSRALVFAERARARDLLEASQGPIPIAPLEPTALAAELKAGTALVYFASLPDRLLAWVFSAGRIEFFKQSIRAADLDTSVARYRLAISRHESAEADTLSERLFERVIAPLERVLPSNGTIVFVPDGALHTVPFGALRNPRTKRYLIEDRAVAIAPSAAMFMRASDRLRHLPELRNGSVLVVGNPRLDAADASGLSDLAGAEAEAADISKQYSTAMVLTGQRATKSAFLNAAGNYAVVHFAGHAIANDGYPLLSRLLFARDEPGQSGVLFTNELHEMRLDRTSLVVLAACQTLAGSVKKGEGAIGLARPFLARGVPTVVATLWDIDDRASRAFFQAFYAALRAGNEPVDALRTAQLSLLRNADQGLRAVSAWAGFVSNGGVGHRRETPIRPSNGG